MKKILIALMMTGAVAAAGCTRTEQGAAIGGLGGAAIGTAISGDAGGAIIGGVAGATAGALIGNATEPGQCRYRDRRGRIYVADC